MTNYKVSGEWRIKINGMEHGVPHVHVEFKDGSRVVVAIESCTVLAGSVIPVKRLADALKNIEENKRAYLDEYRRLNP